MTFRGLGKIAIFRLMESEAQSTGARSQALPDGALATRTLTAGDGWSLREIICRAGPSDRSFEERHEGFSVSAVLEGSFTYRCDSGHGLLYPGALMLGNNGHCFECGHAHGIGDRCVSLNVHEELFGEIAASAQLTSRFLFSVPTLPPSPKALPITAHMEALTFTVSSRRRDELAIELIERVINAIADNRQTVAAPIGREAARVVEAIQLVEDNAARPIELKEMATTANMSKYHFLRVFRRLTGVTPHQYLISARLRRAALALASSRRPVLEIALDAGFGDLSTFNRRFRTTFGLTPTQYRAARL
jgi:AraC family transcriptional regulator